MISAVTVTSARNEKIISNLLELSVKLKQIADETALILDNASKQTLLLLQQCFDRVIPLPNKGMFEDYFPEIMKAARFEWILRIDDDERLSCESWTYEKLRSLAADKSCTHYWFPRRWLVNENEYICSDVWYPDYQLRLFRNIPGIVVPPKKIHEALSVARGGGGAYAAELYIDHLDLALNSFEDRLKKVEKYRALRPYNSCEKYYLYERYTVDTAPVSREKPNFLFRALITDIEMPERLYFGDTYSVKMRVYNLSSRTISSYDKPLYVSYHIFSVSGERSDMYLHDGERTAFSCEIRQGESAEVLVRFSAPACEGTFKVQFDIVEEHVAWYSHHNDSSFFPLAAFSVRNKFGFSTDQLRSMKKLFLMTTPEYGNVGDHAITMGETKFLRENFPDYYLIEISGYDIDRRPEYLDLTDGILNERDLLFLQGDGNLGNIYVGEERRRRDIVRRFPNNLIVIFPQTVWFSDDEDGRRELRNSAEAYNRENILLFARDPISLEFAQHHFPGCRKNLCPDMFLYGSKSARERCGGQVPNTDVLLLLRSDGEKTVDSALLADALSERGLTVGADDMTYDFPPDNCLMIDKELRDIYVDIKLKKVQSAKLVVTDRFHGLLFSFLSGRPCIVMASLTHKTLSAERFFRDAPGVRFVSEIKEDFPDIVEEMLNVDVKNDLGMFDGYFSDMKETIDEMIKRGDGA